MKLTSWQNGDDLKTTYKFNIWMGQKEVCYETKNFNVAYRFKKYYWNIV